MAVGMALTLGIMTVGCGGNAGNDSSEEAQNNV